jgi:(5-formylfuran-3-yl)methyl phosphate synthase
MNNATQLLVSVRSSAEALAALEGGAALIDVKEPSRGSLGRADARVIHEVAAAVAGRRPISAAMGEWAEEARIVPDVDLAYVKWGLAGCRRRPDWRKELAGLVTKQHRPQVVLVAYADWQCAQAPSVEEVFALARERPGSVMLLDTHCKDASTGSQKRPTLLDWLPAVWVEDLCGRCREAHVKIALAGSLGTAEIAELRAARPDWFAVRGAVCDEGNRQAGVQVERVRQLVEIVNNSFPSS